MQLDRNRIVIRERGWLELLDLALLLARAYAWPLALTLLAGIIPAMLFNAWLLHGLSQSNLADEPPMEYLWYILLLTLWEIPLATAPATLFLGEAVFLERPGPKRIAAAFWHALPQLLWYQTIKRAFCIATGIGMIIPFVTKPYLNEVILLERNPMRERRRGEMTTARRGRALHAGYGGDLFARWILSSLLGGLLLVAFASSLYIFHGVFFAEWDNFRVYYLFYIPAALWMTVGFFTVVRFLAYLDLRIRREGWEIELLMRAEGAKITRQLT
jgi:hypothetical protein